MFLIQVFLGFIVHETPVVISIESFHFRTKVAGLAMVFFEANFEGLWLLLMVENRGKEN